MLRVQGVRGTLFCMNTDPDRLVETAPRVRIAPSPTGTLHIGTARTALFNWLYAKKHGGTFIVRVEDTDRNRSTLKNEKNITENLKWLGLDWQEGVEVGGDTGPYRQTERLKLYRPYIEKLLKKGAAYFCYCTQEELDAERKLAQKNGRAFVYSGRCCKLSAETIDAYKKRNRRAVIRFKVPDQAIEAVDEVHGKMRFHTKDFGDFVIAKSLDEPLFAIANTIDDGLMRISHVIRGDEHIPNIPKQVLLAQALGFSPPRFAHIPLILNPDRTKISKRAGATGVTDYKKLGYLPEAIVNFIALLGWNPGTTQEVFTRKELTAAFNLRQINKAGSIFDIKRLQWMNSQYLRKLSYAELLKLAEPFWPKEAKADVALKSRALATVRDRLTHFAELPDLTRFYFVDTVTIDPKLLTWKKSTAEQSQAALKAVGEHIATLDDTTFESAQSLEGALKEFVTKSGKSVGEVFWPLRVALSGSKASPGPQEILWVLGKDASLKRIGQALKAGK